MVRVLLTVFILFTIFLELSEPSTNFIRVSVGSESSSDQKSESESNSLEEINVCYATLPMIHHIEVIPFESIQFISETITFVDNYNPDIFQPPKI